MSDLLVTGLELMLLGMGIVFGFLILLVFSLKAMSWLAGRLPGGEPAAQLAEPAAAMGEDGTLLAVISAAVARYRSQRNP
jgi:oxaloacetate decarboxylase gamma subunit